MAPDREVGVLHVRTVHSASRLPAPLHDCSSGAQCDGPTTAGASHGP